MDDHKTIVEGQPVISSQHASSTRIFPLVIVGIVMLLLGLGGGYLLFGNKNKTVETIPNPIVQATPPTTQLERPTTIPTKIATSVVKNLSYTPQLNNSLLKDIKYTLPPDWQVNLNDLALVLSGGPSSGHIAIRAYDFPSEVSRREFFCKAESTCLKITTFTPVTIGNLTGYMTENVNSGGSKYFGAIGNKFYTIFILNPTDRVDTFDKNYQEVLNSLIF